MEESFITPNQESETSPDTIKRGKIEKELTNVLENYADNEENFSDIYKKISALSIDAEEFLNKEKKIYKDFLQQLWPHSYRDLPNRIAEIEAMWDEFSRERISLMFNFVSVINCFEDERDRLDHFRKITKINNSIVLAGIAVKDICDIYWKLLLILK